MKKQLVVGLNTNKIYLMKVVEDPRRPGIKVAVGRRDDRTEEAVKAVFDWLVQMHKENEPNEAYAITFEGSEYELLMVKKELTGGV